MLQVLALRFEGRSSDGLWFLVARTPITGRGWLCVRLRGSFGKLSARESTQVDWFRTAEECDGFVAGAEPMLTDGFGYRFLWAEETRIDLPPDRFDPVFPHWAASTLGRLGTITHQAW